MKKTINRKLVLFITVVAILSVCFFTILLNYNKKVSSSASSDLGTLYMSEMMLQVQDHFETIIELKNKEIRHIAKHYSFYKEPESRKKLQDVAADMDFEYLALYDKEGNYETILGEAAWYRNLNKFISRVNEKEETAITGYLTTSGEKYIVFGVPFQHEMTAGKVSDVLLAGFSVNKLYEYINLDELTQIGKNVSVEIVLTNGSYVIKENKVEENSFFEYISNFGDFVGMKDSEGKSFIEKSMAYGNTFSTMVSLKDEMQHFYGAPAGEPDDWYFIISMPQGFSDQIINNQHRQLSRAFLICGITIAVLLFSVFFCYLNLLGEQMKKTEAARAEAETANKAKSTFLSNMSHDIRTPMNAIVGYTSIIEHSITGKDTETALTTLSKMRHASNYLRSLISDVLDMSKIEVGKLELFPETVSLTQVMDNIVSLTHTLADARQLTFRVNIHNISEDSISCDHIRLQQVLVNLLSNAIKFTPNDGTVDLEVWQETSKKGSDFITTKFIISDTGIGMSPKFIETMFDSFTREDSKVRKVEGTGLGLAITKNLIDMMDGTITAESREGMGSKFFVSIDFPKNSSNLPEESNSLNVLDGKELKILIAEDNDFNYDIAQYILSSNGFITERAENGQIAVEKYCETPSAWTMILMDLRMPLLNGYQATEKIRQFESTLTDRPHIPIYALSADVFAEDIEKCLQSGMDGHIAKPININELFQVLQQHIH